MFHISHVGTRSATVVAAIILFGGAAVAAAAPTLYASSIAVAYGRDAEVPAVVFDGQNVWVAVQEPNGGYVAKLNASGGILSATAVGSDPAELAYDGARIWVTDYSSNDVTVIAANGAVVKQFLLPIKAQPEGILFDGKYVWVANNGAGSSISNTVSKYDPTTLTLVANYPVGLNPDGVAFDGKYIWITNSYSNNVMKLNRETGAIVGTYPAGVFPLSILFDGRNMWIGNGDDVYQDGYKTGSVTRLAANGNALGTFPVGSAVRGLAFDGASIWVCNSLDSSVTRLRASDGLRLGTYAAGPQPRAMAFDGTRLWVADSGGGTVTVIASNTAFLPSPELNTNDILRPVAPVVHPPSQPPFGPVPGEADVISGGPLFSANPPAQPPPQVDLLVPLQTPVDQAFSGLVVQSPGVAAAVAALANVLLSDD